MGSGSFQPSAYIELYVGSSGQQFHAPLPRDRRLMLDRAWMTVVTKLTHHRSLRLTSGRGRIR